jgi:hypothetical protein
MKNYLPHLQIEMSGRHEFTALKGNLFAFVDYPVPQFSLPPWKITRSTAEIVNFPGFIGEQRLFAWGGKISPFSSFEEWGTLENKQEILWTGKWHYKLPRKLKN